MDMESALQELRRGNRIILEREDDVVYIFVKTRDDYDLRTEYGCKCVLNLDLEDHVAELLYDWNDDYLPDYRDLFQIVDDEYWQFPEIKPFIQYLVQEGYISTDSYGPEAHGPEGTWKD